jgi:regulation of enolase protein 1 (concanavalin A-like superfamily)
MAPLTETFMPNSSKEALQIIRDRVHDEIVAEIVDAVVARMPQPKPLVLSEDEQRWVKMAIEREAQSAKFRQAVIEKSTSALVWSAIVGLGYVLKEWFVNHGVKF